MAQLSPYRLRKARETYNLFNVFNAISWNLLVGVIITLFALRLGATPTFIGLMSSAFYIALFLLPLGKLFAKRFSIIGVFSVTWIVRSICMVFAVAAPFFDIAGHRNIALSLVLLGVFLFHAFRGIGMIGNNPVLSQLASGPDRGSYMTQIQIIGSSIGMFGSFFIAMILGLNPPVFIFSILLMGGIVTGVISGTVIRKVPEPSSALAGEKNKQKTNLVKLFKEALAQDSLRHFMLILFFVVMVSGVSRTFVVVYVREVFEHNDGLILLYSVFGGLGFLMAGLSVKFLVDRIGAKPLFLVCIIIGLVCFIPIIFFPASAIYNMTAAILFFVFIFFMLNFGFLGAEGIAQTYFLALIPSEKILDMGILYFFVFGAAGAAGSFLSGLLLDFLMFLGLSSFVSFKVLFSILMILAIAALAMKGKMVSLGSLPLRGALEVIFSLRDLRAISLIDKLNKTHDSTEEENILSALHVAPSLLSTKSLLERARSPRLATRLESMSALEKMPVLGEDVQNALLHDITQNQFTTAYISARILGKHNCKKAVSMLREFVSSRDYMLAGESMIALAKMKDTEFRPNIEEIILGTDNPRLKIMGCEALGMFHSADSLVILLEILRKSEPHLYLRDEAVLAIAAILGTQRQFYPVLKKYVADNSLILALGMDEAEAALEHCKGVITVKRRTTNEAAGAFITRIESFQSAVREFMENNNGSELSGWILNLPDDICRGGRVSKTILGETVLDDEYCSFNGLKLLIVNWVSFVLRTWAGKLK